MSGARRIYGLSWASTRNLLLTYGTDYKEVRHERTTAIIHEFFARRTGRIRSASSSLRQRFDYEGTAGRLLSSSYAPLEGHPSHAPMMRELERILSRPGQG
jgi:hypothetical protein